MATVRIDISVFTPTNAFGMVSGCLEVGHIPQIGGTFNLRLSTSVEASVGRPPQPFHGALRVENRLEPDEKLDRVLLMLEDVIAATPEQARRFIELCEDEHGLYGDVWEDFVEE